MGVVSRAAAPPNKELKLTKPARMELRSLTLCSTDGEESRGARLGAMAPYLTRAEYLVAAAKPKRRFKSISLEGPTLTLRNPIPTPSYWFERNEIGQEHPSRRYVRRPDLGTISLVVDGKTVAFFYLMERRLDTCTFAYDLTPAQLSRAVRIMKRAGLSKLIRPAAEWAIKEMPAVRRPVLETALRKLLTVPQSRGRGVAARRRTKS
jgi:hypothetical protein